MDRELIEKLSINRLRVIAALEKIDTKGSRVNILERVLSYFYEVGWPKENYLIKLVGDARSVGGSSGAGLLPPERELEHPRGMLSEQGAAEAAIAGLRGSVLDRMENSLAGAP